MCIVLLCCSYAETNLCVQGGDSSSHVFTWTNDGASFRLFCNMSIDGGGWMVVHRSYGEDPKLFNRTWAAYQQGFGVVQGAHWLGNDNIHKLTSSAAMELRIDFVTAGGASHFLKYNGFQVGPETDKFRLQVGRLAPSSYELRTQGLGYHAVQFSTPDHDSDLYAEGNCAAINGFGWWWNKCFTLTPFGRSRRGTSPEDMAFFEMKVRPVSFT